MSTTFVIRGKAQAGTATWMPQSGTFDFVLLDVAEELQPQDEALATALRQATEDPLHYFSLEELDAKRFQGLFQASVRAFERTVRNGPQAVARPDAYGWAMVAFSEFKGLLRVDERLGPLDPREAKVLVREGVSWAAPGWIADMALEMAAVLLQLQQPDLAEVMLEGRSLGGSGICDLRSVPSELWRALLPHLEPLDGCYGDGKGRLGHAPGFYRAFGPRLRDLKALLHGDARARSGES
jgi:hypothetical protein